MPEYTGMLATTTASSTDMETLTLSSLDDMTGFESSGFTTTSASGTAWGLSKLIWTNIPINSHLWAESDENVKKRSQEIIEQYERWRSGALPRDSFFPMNKQQAEEQKKQSIRLRAANVLNSDKFKAVLADLRDVLMVIGFEMKTYFDDHRECYKISLARRIGEDLFPLRSKIEVNYAVVAVGDIEELRKTIWENVFFLLREVSGKGDKAFFDAVKRDGVDESKVKKSRRIISE